MDRLYTLGLYEKAMPMNLSWKEKLIVAKQVGYDFIEISIDETEEKISRIYISTEERFRLVQDMYEVGVTIQTMCVSALTKYSLGNPDITMQQRGMEIVEGAIRLAADLGIRIIMIPGYDVYYQQSTPDTQIQYMNNLKRVVESAAKHGVLIGLETMENNFMNTVWKAMYYVNTIQSNYLGVYPDTGNLKNAAVLLGHDEVQDLRLGIGHVMALHLKESSPGIFREVPYGEGHVEFNKMIEAAWGIGVRKYVTEFWYTGSSEWKEEIQQAYDGMTDILNQQAKES